MSDAIETADLYRGAYLLCCGGRIGETRLARGQVLFVIEGDEVIEEDRRYRTGKALVNPVQLRETVNRFATWSSRDWEERGGCMARIPPEEIARLKAEISVQRLAEGAGVVLARHGADLIGLCPFHDDHEPSLVITPGKNLWHCLGACAAGGSVIDWVMKSQGISFRHAAELLRTDHPSLVAGSSPRPVKRSTVKKMEAPVAIDADDRNLLSQVVDFYHETFKESFEAKAYLAHRGLMSSEMVERFRIGFVNRTLGYRLPDKNRAAGEKMRGSLTRIGILRGSGHEQFNGSIVVPIFGVRQGSGLTDTGEVQGIYGRKITKGLRPGTPQHLYLPGPHKGVFNEQAVAASPEIILCEAILDALTFWCAGYRNVTSSYGINGFTDDHLAAFKKHGTTRVLIAYDRDDAGEKAAATLAEKLLAEGMDCYRIRFPKGMDANEYALKVTPAEKSLGVAIRNAAWMGKGKPRGERIGLGPAVAGSAPEPPPAGPSAESLAGPGPAASSLAAKEKDGGIPILPSQAAPPPPADSDLRAAVPATGQDSIPPLLASEPPAVLPIASEIPAASPVPSAPAAPDVPATVTAEEVVIVMGDRRYRIRGLGKNQSFDAMKVNLLCARGEGFFVDTFDLYAARPRAIFIKAAAEETGTPEETIKKDLGKVLLKLEQLQEEAIKKSMEPKVPPAPQMAEAERDAALFLLRDPDLLGRILTDFTRCGIVGEETNKLCGYLCVVSRKLPEPLAVMIQSSSAAGKTALMDAVLSFVPEEDKVQYSAMTGQSLFYLGDRDVRHKVLGIAEEEGVRQAAYALKLLQSEGELTIASTGKDPATGKLVTHEYRVEGPVMIFMTTTAVVIEDEELQNRCVTLTVNEDREQTKAIHILQRERQTLTGLLAAQRRAGIRKVHKNAQRLLAPLAVVNPYANLLTFRDDCMRTRRDHMKYLILIGAIALLHQYQREIKTQSVDGQDTRYIEATLGDIATANRLAHEVLGRSLDELSPQTRRLLLLLDEMVEKECARLAMARSDYRFTRRQVRSTTGMGDTQLKVHLARLVDLEYLVMHRSGKGNGFVYELLYDGRGKDGHPFLMGLIDVETLERYDYDKSRSGEKEGWSGVNDDRSGSGRPLVGPRSGGGRDAQTDSEPAPAVALPASEAESPEKALIGEEEQKPSYVAVDSRRSDTLPSLAAASSRDAGALPAAAVSQRSL